LANAVEILFSTPNFREVTAAIGSVGSSLDKLSRAGQSAHDRAAKAADKSFKDTARSAEKAARDGARAQEREAREALRIRQQLNQLEVRDWQQKEREKTRAAAAEERRRVSDSRRALGEQRAAHERSMREMESRARSFGRTTGGAVTRALGTAGRIAATAATLGGGFTIADSLSRGVREEATAGVIFRGASNRGEFTSPKQVQDLASATALKTGGTTEDILAGLDQSVRKTGDLGAAKELLEDMAKLSAATGTNFADMGSTAAEVQNQLGDAAKTMEVMRALAGQGRAGAIDIKDLGQYGGRLAASAAQFTGDAAGNIESFGAIAQLAKKLGGATGPAESTEAVARLASDFTMHQQGFRDLGVEVFADKGRTKFRPAEDILTEVVTKTKGDISKIDPLFGEMSMRAARGAQVAFTRAGGGAAGEAAIRSQFRDLRSATLSTGDVDEGVRGRMAENDAKLNNAMTELRNTVNDRLIPILPGLIEQVVRLIPAFGRFLDFLTSLTPWQGIGLVVGAAIATDIARAAVGKGVEAAIVAAIRAMGGGGGGGVEGAAAGGGMGVVGKTLAFAGAAVTGYGIGSAVASGVIDPMLKGEERGKTKAGIVAGNVESVESALRAGRISPQQAEEQRSQIATMVAQARAAGSASNAGSAVLGSITGVGPGVGQFKENRAFAQESEQVTKALQKLTSAIEEKAGQIATVDVPGGRGVADPNHPSRGALAP